MTPPERHPTGPNFILDQNSGPQMTAGLIQNLLSEVRDNSIALASFNSELKNLRDTVIMLSKILKDGNGQASVLTRLSVMEKTVQDLEIQAINISVQLVQAVRDIRKELSDLEDKRGQAEVEEKRILQDGKNERLKFWASIVTSVIALAGAIAALAFG